MHTIKLGFVLELHKILMNSVRGQDKSPGSFRKDQNWIGSPGCAMENATFVPPNEFQLQDGLIAWGQYINGSDIDVLVQTAIMHAQFELLHPFKDGNGRIGRILIPLFLYQTKALSHPMLYLSEYLESHRDEYYQKLTAISAQGDWNAWIIFFLEAVAMQATTSSKVVASILTLYDEMKQEITDAIRSQYSVFLLDAIFSKPIFASSDLSQQLHATHKTSKATTLRHLRLMKDAGILLELKSSSGRTPAIFYFSKLMQLAERREVI